MEKLIENTLLTVVNNNQCTLCNVVFQSSSHRKGHKRSPIHQTHVTEFRNQLIQKIGQKRQHVHVISDNDCNCIVCDIKTPTKTHMWDHLKGSKHNNRLNQLGLPPINKPYGPFDTNMPVSVVGRMLSDQCHICKMSLATLKQALDHYTSTAHQSATQHLLKPKVNQSLQVPRTIIEPRKLTPERTSETIYCYLCSTKVPLNKLVHVISFPHANLMDFKSDLIKKGIIENFWVSDFRSISCNICQIMNMDPVVATNHFCSPSHQVNYASWCKNKSSKKVIPEEQAKWFYCKYCDKALDGTSEAGQHYTFPNHIKKKGLFCEICQISNSSPESLKIHTASREHLSKMKELQKDAKYGKNSPSLTPALESAKSINGLKPTDGSESLGAAALPPVASESQGSNHLKEKVFNELQKLVQNLYYSRKVPYEVSLNFLKRVNEEVGELSKNYAEKDSSDATKPLEAALVEVDTEHNGETIDSNLKKDYSVELQEQSLINNYEHSESTQRPIVKSSEMTDTGQNCRNDSAVIHDDVVNLPRDVAGKYEPSNASLPCQTPRNITDLLNDIVQKKLEVEQDFTEDRRLEKMVLVEIESLLSQIESGGVPLEETLKCLEKFNEEIEINLSEGRFNDELKPDITLNQLECVQEVGEVSEFKEDCETFDEKAELSTDLEQGQVEEKTNDMVQVTGSSKLRYTIEELKMLNTMETCGQIDQNLKAKLIGVNIFKKNLFIRKIPCSIYDYHNGANFDNFMEFSDEYLQGSINKLIEKKEKENHTHEEMEEILSIPEI